MSFERFRKLFQEMKPQNSYERDFFWTLILVAAGCVISTAMIAFILKR